MRLEALHKMFNFGQANLMLLADVRQQRILLDCFLDERPHLEMPQPRGEPTADTLQGLRRVYLYLDAVGSELADSATDRNTLQARNRDILSEFTDRASALRTQWVRFDQAVRKDGQSMPDMPGTIIEALWADVTAKTKSIALSKVFGPMHEAGMMNLLKLVAEHAAAQEVEEFQTSLARVRAAVEPEDIKDPRQSSS